MRYVRHKTRNSKKGENEIVFTLQPEAKVLIDKYMSRNGHLQFGKYSSYKQIYSLVFRHINKVTELSGVKKKVTYYSARKTFAQHGYDLGIQIEKIEYCIGHSMKITVLSLIILRLCKNMPIRCSVPYLTNCYSIDSFSLLFLVPSFANRFHSDRYPFFVPL